MDNISPAYKMAAGICIMCFVISIGLAVLFIANLFMNKEASLVDNVNADVPYAELYYMAINEDPVPVAAVYRCVSAIPDDLDMYIKKTDGTVISAEPVDLLSYLKGKARVTYSEGKKKKSGVLVSSSSSVYIEVRMVA